MAHALDLTTVSYGGAICVLDACHSTAVTRPMRARGDTSSGAPSVPVTQLPRQTRSGSYFSPYELLDFINPTPTRPFQTIQLKTSLAALLQQSIADTDLHAHYQDVPPALSFDGASDNASSFNPKLTCATCLPPTSGFVPPLYLSPPPSASPPPSTPRPRPSAAGVERRHKNERAHAQRSLRRQKLAAQSTPYDHNLNPRHTQEYRRQASHSTMFDLADAPVAAGAWIGRRSKRPTGRIRTLPELLNDAHKLVEWNGRDPKLILDAEGRIVAILLGTPDDPDWPNVVEQAAKAMDRAQMRRLACWSGPSAGGDTYSSLRAPPSARPGNLRNTKLFNYLVKELLRNKSIHRIAGFQSDSPRPIRALPPTSSTPLTTRYFLLPPSTAETRFCPVTSAGKFDHKLGGHIYLGQLRLVIEFPSGATAIIPSDCVDHGNTPIQANETRFSITQFAAGGLFCWVEYGFQTAKSLLAQAGGQVERDAFDGVPGSRWQWALSLFSKVDELAANCSLVFTPQTDV
ncbi:hypothetical protein C8F04DRAFT_1264932 [Mycena alexandri]|uniref:Uncharacterized protein n=1 Tax=Mycena alexandri TaxID=1745969 RepID=A0AAD6SK56_9AGAR|nr:hypothetical protein C8F04DRAFT_1264932 [Mycena alexandri]